MSWRKVLGLAGFAGVAATGVVIARAERRRRAYTSQEGRARRNARRADAVAAMCGAHAQVLSAAELSVGLRLGGATRADVRAALWTERSLVKVFGPRGTVHLLPTRDLALWTGALAAIPARVPAPAPAPAGGVPADWRLTAEQTEEVVAAIGGALDE